MYWEILALVFISFSIGFLAGVVLENHNHQVPPKVESVYRLEEA